MNLIRIDQLFLYEKGTLQSTKCIPGKYDFITASSEWKTHNEATHDCEALIFAAAASGSLGRTHYVQGKFVASDLCFILTPKDPENFPVDLKFYHILFNEFKDDIVKNTKAGTSKEAISLGSFGGYKMPYFKIEDQCRIKEKFISLQNMKLALADELYLQTVLIKKLSAQILQDAIMGKLVPQEIKEESAAELLIKIKEKKRHLENERKIRKERELQPIKKEEIPFEIPKNWVWCRLGDLAISSEAGKSFKCDEVPISGDEWGVIKVSAVSWGDFLEEKNKIYSKERPEDISAKIEVGDFIISRANTSELVGKSVVVKNLTKNLLLSDKTIRFKFSELIDVDYINLCNNGFYARKYYSEMGTGSSPSMKNITREHMRNLLIPLAPRSEQYRILSKVRNVSTNINEIARGIEICIFNNENLIKQLLREGLELQK